MSTTVRVAQDVYTAASSQNSNFEGNDLLVYGSGSRIYSYIEFDLSSFAGKEITEAVIKLYIAVNNLTSDTNIRFYRIDQSWDASEVTFNEPPHVTSTNAKGKTLENEDINWECWNITDLVKDIISSGGYGIRVEIDANQIVQFSSIEGDYSHRPKLVITELVCEIRFSAFSGGVPVENARIYMDEFPGYFSTDATGYSQYAEIECGTLTSAVIEPPDGYTCDDDTKWFTPTEGRQTIPFIINSCPLPTCSFIIN